MNRWHATTTVRRVPGTGRTGSIAAERAPPFRQLTPILTVQSQRPDGAKMAEMSGNGNSQPTFRTQTFSYSYSAPKPYTSKNHASFESTHDTNAQRALEHAHLMTDGACRDIEFPGRARDRPVASGRLEGTQRIERR
jgi:hypothetical protein